MTNQLKLGLGALVLSAAALATSGCEVCNSGCTSFRRMPQAQGCYQGCPTGVYEAPAQTGCYTPSVCGPTATVK